MPPARHLIAIDLGGTKTAAAIVDVGTGEVFNRLEVPTLPARGAAEVFRSVEALVAALFKVADAKAIELRGIGLGICEIVNREGLIRSAATIDWRGRDLSALGGGRLSVHLISDVRASALAESRLGRARKYVHALYVSIGTGIASVPIIDGVPYAGSNGAALVLATAPRTNICDHCGATMKYVLEDIASGQAIARAFSNGRSGDARDLLLAAGKGDAAALALIARATTLLGDAVGQLANCLDPQAIIVGGGLGSAPGAYWDQLQNRIRLSLWTGSDAQPDILQSSLGADAGLIGAALALDHGLH